MNCIVTAGPTYEPLDEVRRLTNFSTGRLGTDLANYLAARGHKVTLLLGMQSTYRADCAATVKFFTTTSNLRDQLQHLAGRKVDAIFHAAAVSDFAFGKMFTQDSAGKLRPFTPSKKIPTRGGELLVELTPTPKIIAELRGWFPQAQIVGWKFEADGKRANAVAAAQRQMAECSTNVCVANGPAYGRGFGIVTPEEKTRHFAHAKDLFGALAERLEKS